MNKLICPRCKTGDYVRQIRGEVGFWCTKILDDGEPCHWCFPYTNSARGQTVVPLKRERNVKIIRRFNKIRWKYSRVRETYPVLAKEFGMTIDAISGIISNRSKYGV